MIFILRYFSGILAGLMLVAAAFLFAGPPEPADTPLVAPLVAETSASAEARIERIGVPPSLLRSDGFSYTEPEVGAIAREIAFRERTRRYHLFAPADLPEGPRPAIVLLHGDKRSGLSMIDMWKDVATREAVVLIAPDSAGDGWTWAEDGPEFLDAVLADAREAQALRDDALYLFGHSAGGALAIRAALAPNAPWRRVASHAGLPNALAVVAGGGNTPLRIYLGTDDHLYPLTDARRIANALARAGHPTDLIEILGHNHWYYQLGPHLSTLAWSWLSGG